MPAFSLTAICAMPGIRHSIGSSTLHTLRCARSIVCSEAYEVVDFPEPVGPAITQNAPGRFSARL